MSVTLYFSKVNINSHIYDVYENPDKLKQILNLLLINICDDIGYEKQEIGHDEDGESYVYTAYYKFSSVEKLGDKYNNTIVGNVIKKSYLYAKQIDEATGEVKKIPVENNEVIRFYFDVYKEIVAFHRTIRFGYAEFNEAFNELINLSMKKHKKSYNFEVSILRKGLNINEIKKQLKEIGRIETLRIEIIPPNPDESLLNDIHENGEEFLKSVKDGNITSRSILFTSKAQEGLFLDAKIITDELTKVESIHSKLSSEEAIGKGYFTVEAEGKNGRKYSTKNNNPIKDKIDDGIKGIVEYAEVCRNKILSIFGNS